MLTKEDIEKHFKHMCNAGYDPLLCINNVYKLIDDIKFPIIESKIDFLDSIIGINMYTGIIERDKTVFELSDVIYIDPSNVTLHQPEVIKRKAAIIWLRPDGCKTLKNMFDKNRKFIDEVLYIDQSKLIIL